MAFITLKNKFKTEVTLCSIGASIYDIKTKDYKGEVSSIVITPQDKDKFISSTSYFGKTIGRTAGRIKKGEFSLNGEKYIIPSSDPNGLHGGDNGLSFKDFSYDLLETKNFYLCEFDLKVNDLEDGYPGNLNLQIIYKLYKNENKLEINYKGISDKDTLLNLSNHTYFNLNALSGNSILDHTLYINSSKMAKINNMIPESIVDLNKIYSFKFPHKIGDYLFDDEIIKTANGYDFPYLFDKVEGENIVLFDNVTKKRLKIYTTYPCVVVYTCNYPENTIMNNNRKEKAYDAVCLECSFLPNSINSNFIDDKKDILKKDTLYDQKIIYKFE